ncbi:MAG: endonuclease/exonuclease/phosphatase family protein [Campylobacterales bacterium]|nr:endonuclease/exonuclease/phosphatase family protein [Campylobacterales bacterium]
MKIFTLLLFFLSLVHGEINLKIATYNVENLFDLKKDGHEYKEYVPNTSSNWNQKTYKIKLQNIAKVIKDVNADIIALQEIESLQALKDLRFILKQNGLYYQYHKIADLKNTTIKVALLSKIPFIYTHEISVTSSYKYRNILEAKFRLNNFDLFILVNHWKSKSGPESQRVFSAKKVMKRVEELGKDKNIILLGDFNSDYEEYKVFKRKRKHNDTDGVTGINHILGSINYQKSADKTQVASGEFYNLWYDEDPLQRYSYTYKGKKETLDSILVSKSLLNSDGIRYKNNSMHSFKTDYLFKKQQVYRWELTRSNRPRHKGKGYSDHLPLIAEFLVH